MTTKKELKRLLKVAKKDLKENKSIPSPLFRIISRNNDTHLTTLIPPTYWNEIDSGADMEEAITDICVEYDADEFFSIGITRINAEETYLNTTVAILITADNLKGNQSVILPYRIDNGKVTFGKEKWTVMGNRHSRSPFSRGFSA